jgi:hypothetical protein
LIFSLFFPSTHPKRSDSQRPASEGEAGNVVHNIITISFDSHPVPHENRKRKKKKVFSSPSPTSTPGKMSRLLRLAPDTFLHNNSRLM